MSDLVGIKSAANTAAMNLHVLTLTPFFPSDRDPANGCFVAEPLVWTSKAGVHNTAFAVQPFYRPKLRTVPSAIYAGWIQYLALPGGIGLSTAGVFLFAKIVGRLRELHAKRKIDVIHAHGPLPCGHAAMLAARELKIPYAVSVHGLDVFSTVQVSGRAGEWCRRISKKVYAGSCRVICVSEKVREQVLEGMGRNCRTSVVHNGVDPNVFYPGAEQSVDSLTLLSVGNLIPTKGHELLVRAVATLAKEFPSLTLEIIGEGPLREKLQNLAGSLGIADKIQFLGRQSRQQVAAAMQRCVIFVLPSRYEGLGCVYLEAMSTGKPIIGCRGQGIADVVRQGSNGYLVGADNEPELTLALAMLLRDESRRKAVGTAARDTILDAFTLEHQAERLIRIYRECSA
jgi:teichuronic acid biosynthesis glycosyltransferase TuaC